MKSDKNGNNEWIPLGKKDPLLPEMFYPTVTNTAIHKNDFLVSFIVTIDLLIVTECNSWLE